jgi:uncharacterized protein (TIGR00730 family)
MKNVGVYCGSSNGVDPVFETIAIQVGEMLAEQGLRLVYGGGKTGLMGAVARACMAAGGEVLGVIPRALMEAERAYHDITELVVVENMHERKDEMIRASDAFIALPGGVGTLEELFEVFTWHQLGLLEKPCGVLNVNGYYDHMLAFLDHAVVNGFLRQGHLEILQVDDTVQELLEKLRTYERKHPSKIAS